MDAKFSRKGNPSVSWSLRVDRKSPSLSSALAEIDVLWITVWRIHAMEGNPTGCMGLPDYLGWQWRSTVGIPMR
jgi:hydrogenase small subunit